MGRFLGRPRGTASHAVAFEISAEREARLWLDAARGTAGLYWIDRGAVRILEAMAGGELPGRTRQALLLLRKHLDGKRVTALNRVPGERTVLLDAAACTLALRLSGPAPALTLAVEGAARATIGEGPPAWPPPAARPDREWDVVDSETLQEAVASAPAAGRPRPRTILAACPSLGPYLARELDGSPDSLAALRQRLSVPQPFVLLPGPLADCHDADLESGDAVVLTPIPLEATGARATVAHPGSTWSEAAALFLRCRYRGAAFKARRETILHEARRVLRRLTSLEAHLVQDLAGLPDASHLRHQAEALLASAGSIRAGVEAEIPDPYDPEARMRVSLDPRLPAAAQADRLFEKARRSGRSRLEVERRLAETRRALEEARNREARALEARDRADLDVPTRAGEDNRRRDGAAETAGGPRHYLTSRGLSVLVGRSARENHHLTFTVARPEDLWFHASDVPGAHVILRDNEGRAGADDLREAAEVAAFFSGARSQGRAEVHVTRRKHVRPARGGPGRVFVSHADTLRVSPRDPEGRLRRSGVASREKGSRRKGR